MCINDWNDMNENKLIHITIFKKNKKEKKIEILKI